MSERQPFPSGSEPEQNERARARVLALGRAAIPAQGGNVAENPSSIDLTRLPESESVEPVMPDTTVARIVRRPVFSTVKSSQKNDLRPIVVVRSRSRTRITIDDVDGIRVVTAPAHPTEPDPVKFGA